MKDANLCNYLPHEERFVEIADPSDESRTLIINKTKIQRVTLYHNKPLDEWSVYIHLSDETLSLHYNTEVIARKVLSYLTGRKE